MRGGRAAVVLAAVVAVVLALLSLLVPPVGFIRSIGVATTVVLVVAVLVAVTAVPATLALLGTNVNRLRLTRREPGTRSRRFWRRQAERILRRPVTWAVAGTAVLAVLALPAGEGARRARAPGAACAFAVAAHQRLRRASFRRLRAARPRRRWPGTQ